MVIQNHNLSTHGENNDPACINLQMLRTSHYVLKAYDKAYRSFGVRATQVPVLSIVARYQPATIKLIADKMQSERSAMSRKLQVMERKGWIREDPKTTSKEKSFILAAKGRQLIERVKPIRLVVQEQLLARLSEQEQALLLSLCGKLQNTADNNPKPSSLTEQP